LNDKGGHIPIAFGQKILATKLRADGLLEKLRGRQTPLLDQPVELVREVHLHARHTPTYTPSPVPLQGWRLGAKQTLDGYTRRRG
jgi:hypothetical protein